MNNKTTGNLRKLDVYLNSELSGNLTETKHSEMIYQYSPKATVPISISMPLSTEQFGNDHCQAFFGGLLPEGIEAKQAIARRFGISAQNNFSLLRAIGTECAGALSLVESGSPSPVIPN